MRLTSRANRLMWIRRIWSKLRSKSRSLRRKRSALPIRWGKRTWLRRLIWAERPFRIFCLWAAELIASRVVGRVWARAMISPSKYKYSVLGLIVRFSIRSFWNAFKWYVFLTFFLFNLVGFTYFYSKYSFFVQK